MYKNNNGVHESGQTRQNGRSGFTYTAKSNFAETFQDYFGRGYFSFLRGPAKPVCIQFLLVQRYVQFHRRSKGFVERLVRRAVTKKKKKRITDATRTCSHVLHTHTHVLISPIRHNRRRVINNRVRPVE